MGRHVIYLTDEEVILYKGTAEKLSSVKRSFEEARSIFETQIDPKSPLCLLIDRNQADIHEDKLPPLFLNRARLLFKKKAVLLTGMGFQF
jgi:hypothetical protein